jgi:hypothetical protein
MKRHYVYLCRCGEMNTYDTKSESPETITCFNCKGKAILIYEKLSVLRYIQEAIKEWCKSF